MNVLISGASIAGPALAYWLQRYGFQVTVVERAPALRPGGYAVDIRGAALDVVARMGLRDVLRPLETDTLSNSVVDARGRTFGRLARGFGVIDEGDVEIHRGDLASVLHDATRASVRYRFGDAIASLATSDAGTSVTFESGARGEFDVVIGADGVHSRTRALAFGEESEFLHDMGNRMAIFTVANHLGLRREQLLFSGLGRVASVKSANDSRDLAVCVFFTAPPGPFDPGDIDAQRRDVHSAFEGAGWAFPRLMGAMWTADDFYSDVTCQIHMERYFAGRVALVGDAAYCPSPLSGQGTSLALVGSYVLATALLEDPLDVERAFERYDARMRPFASANQAVARKIARGFAPSTPLQVWSRNAAMRMLPYMPAKSAIMKLALRGVREASLAIALPG